MIPAIFTLFSLGQIGRISFFNQHVNIYCYEIFLFFILFWFIVKHGLKPLFFAYQKFGSIFLFFCVTALSYLITSFTSSIFANIIAFLYLIRLFMYFIFFIYGSYHVNRTYTVRPFHIGMKIFIVVTLLSSVLQYLFYPDLRNLYYLGWDPHLYRVFGIFFDTSIMAAIIGLILLYLLKLKSSLIRNGAISMYTILGLLTYSRAFYLAAGITLVYFLFLRKRYFYIGLSIVIFSVALILLPRPRGEGVNLARTYSIISREADYNDAFKIFSGSPLLGIGYNRIAEFKAQNTDSSIPNHAASSFHSSFLIIIVTTGLVGLIAFVYLLFQWASISIQSRLIILFLSIFSLFDNILLHPFILFFLTSVLIEEYMIAKR